MQNSVVLPCRHGRARALGIAFLLFGCSTSIEPIQVADGCPDRPLREPSAWENEPSEQLIDDFEDGDPHIATVSQRDGAWIIGSDFSGALVAENSSRCAARGEHAGHFAGSGFTEWGANWTAVFRRDQGGTAVGYDGSAYSAISFFAAVGPGAAPPLEVPMGITTLDVAWNGGVCSSDKCMDFYRTKVELTGSWERVVVPFADLAQTGKGDPLTALKKDELVGFIIWPSHRFDVWIDDVRFEP